MLAVRSFLFLSLAALFFVLAVARSDPLNPPLHTGHLSRESALRPLSRSPRALLRARQVVPPSAGQVAAAREAHAWREAVARLDRARAVVEEAGEEVTRRAERVRRAKGGVREAVVVEEEGQAVHDTLFRLIQVLTASADAPSATVPVDDPLDAIANFAAARHAAAAPSASAAPRPSGHTRARRALPARVDRDPLAALSQLLSTLNRTVSVPLSDILPSLPPVLRDSVRALLEAVGEEAAGVVEGALLLQREGGSSQGVLGGMAEGEQGGEERLEGLLRLVKGNVTGP